jgi:hypothetical protein
MPNAPAVLRIHNWPKFQHYKKRNPPWVKMHRSLLNDPDWFTLSGDACKLLAGCWLLASETMDGSLPSIEAIAFRLREPEDRVRTLLNELAGWIDNTETMLAPCLQDASNMLASETETETEKSVCPVGQADRTAATQVSTEHPAQKPVVKPKKPLVSVADDQAFWDEITELYTHVNVPVERVKMKGWMLQPRNKIRKITREFVVRWLNKIDRPLEGKAGYWMHKTTKGRMRPGFQPQMGKEADYEWIA